MRPTLPAEPPGDLLWLERTVWDRLRTQYAGVFDIDRLRAHVIDHVEGAEAANLIELVVGLAPEARSVIDVGCGFGAFVEAGRRAGLDVVGVDRESIELAFARSRTDGASTIVAADVEHLPFASCSADAVTMWNLLEHVDSPRDVLREATRVTRPGGWLFILAPNYDALRSEAHYHVPWGPFMRDGIAMRWLRLLGRDPRFWRDEVRPCTMRQIRGILTDLGLEPRSIATWKLTAPERIRSARARTIVNALVRARLLPIVDGLLRVRDHLPWQRSIALAVRTP